MRKVIAVPVCLSLLVFVAPPALGGGAAEVKVGIKSYLPAFHGKVESPKPACKERRVVYLYREKGDRDTPDRLLGDDLTGRKGRWEILAGEQFTLTPGIYYAVAPALPLGSGTKCQGDRSRRVYVS